MQLISVSLTDTIIPLSLCAMGVNIGPLGGYKVHNLNEKCRGFPALYRHIIYFQQKMIVWICLPKFSFSYIFNKFFV